MASALAELVGYHAVEASLQSKQLLGEARAGLAKMTHISHVRCGWTPLYPPPPPPEFCWCRAKLRGHNKAQLQRSGVLQDEGRAVILVMSTGVHCHCAVPYRDEVLVTLATVSDFSYAWGIVDAYTPVLQAQVIDQPLSI